MSHRGSLLIVPSGIYAWDVGEHRGADAGGLRRIPARDGAARASCCSGRVPTHHMPPEPVRRLFAEARAGARGHEHGCGLPDLQRAAGGGPRRRRRAHGGRLIAGGAMTRRRADDPASDCSRAGRGPRGRPRPLSRGPARAAPRARRDLIALTAFLGEVARIPEAVSEPMMGEIRLQWWRDALETLRAGGKHREARWPTRSGRVMARHALPEELLVSRDRGAPARPRARPPRPRRPQPELAAYLATTEGAAFRLSARVLGVDAEPGRVRSACGRGAGLRARPHPARAPCVAGEWRQRGSAPARRTSSGSKAKPVWRAGGTAARGRFTGDPAGCPRGALFGGFGKAWSRHRQRDRRTYLR